MLGQRWISGAVFSDVTAIQAAAVITILPILIIFITLQRWLVQAVVMSGLKG